MKTIIQRIFILGLVLCLIPFGSIALADTNVLQNQAVDGGTINQNIIFVDVDNNHWANNAIHDMAQRGVLSGYDDSTFRPDKSITREEFAKLIALTFSLSLENPSVQTFTDVNSDRWSYSYVESTKDFLTGYFPPKGKAFFSPETKATREDVAVALVKVMGYTSADLNDPNILARHFYDAGDVSVGLRDYVAIATEKQLIGGYDDGTFRPENPITRAEVATLLYRVIKSSVQDQANGPQLDVSMPETTQDGTFYISGKTQRDAKVFVKDKAVEVVDGEFKEGYSLNEEGTYDIQITAKIPSGKTTTVHKKITYKVDGPAINLDDIPDTVNKKTLTISGTVKDANDNYPTVSINDEKVSVYYGSFSQDVTLNEGENTFTVKAKNSKGKETIQTKKVTFNVGGPDLTIDSIPNTTSSKTITISGTVKDKNDNYPTVYINDKKVSVYYGSFSQDFTLNEGENSFTVKASNSNGKETVQTKKITFNVGGPDLTIDSIPNTTSSKTITISGTVKDKNDNYPTVYINDKKVSVYYGSFSQDFTLNEGENTFTVKASNSNGKETVQTKTVTFGVGAPVIKLSYFPKSTTQSSVTITGTVTDANDNYPVVFFNDQKIYLSYGSFSQDFSLQKGANTFSIVAANSYGKTSTVTDTVYRQ